MARKYKVRRYGYEWGGQRKHWWQKILVSLMVVAVAGGIGWLAYEPVYNFVVGIGESGTAKPPVSSSSPAMPPAATPQPGATPAPQEAQVSGMPSRLYYLPEAIIMNTAQLNIALADIKAKGGDGVMFDLKNEAGLVLYDSSLPIVTENLALAEQTYSLAQLTATIKGAGLAPVGRLFAFKDHTATASMNEGAVKYMDSKVNWIDNAKADGGKAWLNPNSALSRDYILQLVEETTASGVSCLVLDGVQFPTGFSLNMATYGGIPDKSAVLADFVTAARQKAEASGGELYPVVSLDAVAGINAIPYGEAPHKLIAAAGQAVLDIRPEQFGIGVTTDSLILTKPLLTPYDALTTAFAAAEAAVQQEDVELSAMVQAYTSTRVEGASNKLYTAAEVEEQIKAAKEAGIDKVLCYNPAGSY